MRSGLATAAQPAFRALAFGVAISTGLLAPVSIALAHHHHASAAERTGPADGTILIIRHAEKPDAGPGLAPAGVARAAAYARYFTHLKVGGAPIRIDALVATSDSAESMRPRLTLQPLGRSLGEPVQQPFADRDVKPLAEWLASTGGGRTTLVAWHHGKLAKLLERLGADPASLLPDGAWPDETYNWVIVLRYDRNGALASAQRIVEPASL